MDYNPISGFLEKFKTILSSSEASHNTIIEIIDKHTGFVIDKSALKIKGTTIYIEGSPVFKTEIFIHKRGILSDLKPLLPNQNFTDIK